MAQLKLNLGEGSVSFPFTPEAAQNLKQEIGQLMKSLKANASQASSRGSRPEKKPDMKYCYTGEVFLEVFCNPNIYPSPFAAKLLLTVRDEKMRLSTEAELTRVIEDLNQYLEQVG